MYTELKFVTETSHTSPATSRKHTPGWMDWATVLLVLALRQPADVLHKPRRLPRPPTRSPRVRLLWKAHRLPS